MATNAKLAEAARIQAQQMAQANILNPDLKEMGAAMARSSKGEPYWIQVFGTLR